MERGNSRLISAATTALACGILCGFSLAQSSPASQTTSPSQTQASGSMSSGSSSAPKDAQTAISSWPDNTKKAAQALIDKYGQPDSVSNNKLAWSDKDQWKEVAVYRDPVEHSSPMPHQDFIENKISYKVPENKVADLIKFDQALVIDETRGTLASHCDSEKANTLALNLADEIVNGKRTVASAKSFLRNTLEKSMAGKSSDYMDTLRFKTSAPAGSVPSAEPSNANPSATPSSTPSGSEETAPSGTQENTPSGTQGTSPSGGESTTPSNTTP